MKAPAKLYDLEAEVIQTIMRTPDVLSIRFRRPEGFNYLPGQWMLVTPGKKTEQPTKPLSLSSSPTEDFLEVTKRLTGHEFSNALAALKPGDAASLQGPYGHLTFHGEHDKICMLSGGIGITPLRSMIRYSVDKKLKTDIVLIYSNRFENGIAFKEDFDALQETCPNFKMISTITNPSQEWKGLTGRINAEMVKRVVPDYADRVFYSCGPKLMVDDLVAMLEEMEIPKERVRFEYFSGYLGAPDTKSRS